MDLCSKMNTLAFLNWHLLPLPCSKFQNIRIGKCFTHRKYRCWTQELPYFPVKSILSGLFMSSYHTCCICRILDQDWLPHYLWIMLWACFKNQIISVSWPCPPVPDGPPPLLHSIPGAVAFRLWLAFRPPPQPAATSLQRRSPHPPPGTLTLLKSAMLHLWTPSKEHSWSTHHLFTKAYNLS